MTKDERIARLRQTIMVMVNIEASFAGGLTETEADHWWDEISDGVMDAFKGVIISDDEARAEADVMTDSAIYDGQCPECGNDVDKTQHLYEEVDGQPYGRTGVDGILKHIKCNDPFGYTL